LTKRNVLIEKNFLKLAKIKKVLYISW